MDYGDIGGVHTGPLKHPQKQINARKHANLAPEQWGFQFRWRSKPGPRNPVEENPGPVDDEVVHHSAMASGLVAVGSHLWSARISTWRP